MKIRTTKKKLKMNLLRPIRILRKAKFYSPTLLTIRYNENGCFTFIPRDKGGQRSKVIFRKSFARILKRTRSIK